MKALVALLLVLAGAASAWAQHPIPEFCPAPTLRSVRDGAWADAATWSGGRIPQAGDVVEVAQPHSVDYGVVNDSQLAAVCVGGELRFRTDASTRLVVGTLVVRPTGLLEIGREGAPVAPGVLAELVIAPVALDAAADPEQYGTGLLGFGRVRLHGAVKSPTFARVTAHLAAGARSIPLEVAPVGWMSGDRLVVPGSQQWFPDAEPWAETWETPTLQGVAGASLAVSALQHAHAGAFDVDGTPRFRPHVGNLSRNVVVRSADPGGVRGHVLFTARADVDIRYARFADLGRTTIAPLSATNLKGRYSLHLHHLIGPVATPANGYQFTLIGNAVDGGTKWGLTLHNTHYGLARDNVVYNAAGVGIMTEDGNESFNVIERNFVVRSWGTGDEQGIARDIWVDSGFEGAGVWLRGVNNYVRDNVVANTNSFAYGIYPQNLGPVRIPKFKGADVSQPGQFDIQNGQATPIREFARNEAYAAYSGLTMWDVMADCCTKVFEGAESVVKDFHVWHLGRHGFYGYGMNRVTFDGWVQRGESTHSWNPYVFNRGLWFADYPTRNLVIRNCDIQGVRAGIEVPYKAGDTSDIYGGAPGTTLIENCNVVAFWGYVTKPQFGVTGGGVNLPPRAVIIRNSRWAPVPWQLPTGWGQVGIARSFQVDERNANIMVSDRMIVEDWQRVRGDSFEAFYVAQEAGFVPAPSSRILVGSPVEGASNAQLMLSRGVAVAGAVTPCTVTRAGVEGFACQLFPPEGVRPPSNLRIIP